MIFSRQTTKVSLLTDDPVPVGQAGRRVSMFSQASARNAHYLVATIRNMNIELRHERVATLVPQAQ
jgi:hypothetical protein